MWYQAWRCRWEIALVFMLIVPAVWSQNDPSEPGPIVVRREPLKLTPPDSYRLDLRLEPVQQLVVSAVCDGTVLSVDAVANAVVKAQEPLVRLDPRERQLQLERALAQLKVADLELAEAKKGGQGGAVELAEARHRLADADVKLLQFQVEQLASRSPFSGTVLKVHVQPGQFVKSGEPLLTLADVSRMKVEVPVDRELTNVGDSLALKIESQSLEVKVESVQPPDAKFEKLRDLATSLASTTLTFDNANGNWKVGQAVFAPLSPRHPVTQVMTGAVGVDTKGHRKVQVIRQGIVRDVEVDLLGQVGAERIYVSGNFVSDDQVVLSSSCELPDGTQLRPNPSANIPPSRPTAATSKSSDTTATKPAEPAKKKAASGF